MGCAQATVVAESEELQEEATRLSRLTQPKFHEQYLLKKHLGAGAFAVVFSAALARDGNGEDREGKEVAVKIVDVRTAACKAQGFSEVEYDCALVRAAKKEARLLQFVAGSDHVCGCLGAYVSDGLSYTLLEKCDRSLVQAMERQRELNEESMRPFIVGMLKGIAYVHSRGVVHRDVKADNFMCSGPADTVKLCDFGFARFLPERISEPCSGVFGTSPFMAPEMLKKRAYNEKVDVWSFGVVVYAFCFGGFPYVPAAWTDRDMQVAIAVGSSRPSYMPAHRSLKDVVSEEMKWLLNEILRREYVLRPSAATLLEHAYFQTESLPRESLRPMFASARNFGAYVCDVSGLTQSRTGDIESHLSVLQDKYHPEARQASKLSLTESFTSTATGLGASIAAGSDSSGERSAA